ncbi:MAG: hypothetical protein ACOC9Z_05000 [Chloroflexota bacterium]
METGLLILLIPVLIILLLYFLPEVWRWLSRRNRLQANSLKATLDDTGETLRTLAARLRPYRELHAGTFRRHYEPARDHLQKVVDRYQRLGRRLATVAPSDEPYGLWAFAHILNNPQEIWQTPVSAVRLWQLRRDVDQLQGQIAHAETLIARAEETPGSLVQATRQLRDQRLSQLEVTLAEDESGSLASGKELQARLSQLQRQCGMLLETVQDRPSGGLGRMDTLAAELEQLEEDTAALEDDINALRRRRRAVETRLQEVQEARTRSLQLTGDEQVHNALEPLLDRAATLESEAKSLHQAERFSQAQEKATEALEILQLAGELAAAASQIHALQEVADISLQSEAIEVLGRRLQTTLSAAYALCEGSGPASWATVAANGDSEATSDKQPPQTGAKSRSEIIDGLKLRVNQLSSEANRIEAAHEQDVAEVTGEADQQTDLLEAAWQELQQTVTVAPADPALAHYRALQKQRSQATGNPVALRAYMDDARVMTGELTTAADTIRHGFRQLEALRVELPGMLEKAEAEAQNWRCLQPLLMEMKEAIATLWQIGDADVHLAEMQATLSEIETLEEQVRAAYAALDGERRRLSVLERRITQMLQTHVLRRSNESIKGGESRENGTLRSRVEARIASARGAESIAAAHGELRATLEWLEEIGN